MRAKPTRVTRDLVSWIKQNKEEGTFYISQLFNVSESTVRGIRRSGYDYDRYVEKLDEEYGRKHAVKEAGSYGMTLVIPRWLVLSLLAAIILLVIFR